MTFSGDTITSFSFKCLQQHLAVLLTALEGKKRNLPGDPHFLPGHRGGMKMVSVVASFTLVHNEAYSYK